MNDRLRVARATRARTTILGEDLPAPFPKTGDALATGLIGLDAALVITGGLHEAARVSGRRDLLAAEVSLIAAATGDLPTEAAADTPPPCTLSELKIQAGVWALWLDQDGVEPRAERQERRRGLFLGTEVDGLTPLRGRLTPEIAARFRRLFDAHLAPSNGVRFLDTAPDAASSADAGAATDAGADGDADGDEKRSYPTGQSPAWTPDDAPVDPRTRGQKQHDLLAVILDAAARAQTAPTIGGSSPTVVITVTAEDLDSPNGVADIDGADSPVPAGIAHRHACTNATQTVVFDRDGRVIGISSPERLFTAHQRRAIVARDGGCIIPGCSIPAGWCEVHHVTEHGIGGPTCTDNGVLLCWWHHHRLEASGWRIRMHRGVPFVRAPGWNDPHGRWRPAMVSRTRRRIRHLDERGRSPG